MLYSIDTGWACFGLITDDAEDPVVVRVAPIASWAIGRRVMEVLLFFRRRDHACIMFLLDREWRIFGGCN